METPRNKYNSSQTLIGSSPIQSNKLQFNDDIRHTSRNTEATSPSHRPMFSCTFPRTIDNQSHSKHINRVLTPSEIAPLLPMQSQPLYFNQQQQERSQFDFHSAVTTMQSLLNQNNSGTESFVRAPHVDISNTEIAEDINTNAMKSLEKKKRDTDSERNIPVTETSPKESKPGKAKDARKQNKSGGDSKIKGNNGNPQSSNMDQTLVEIKVVFVRILDVDTSSQLFEAEVYIQARWAETQFSEFSEEQLQEIEFEQCWDPLLTITNTIGSLETDRASMLLRYEPERVYPVLTYMWHVGGVFREVMELQHFPFDVQELSIILSSERSIKEVELVCDYNQLSNVSQRALQGNQEWTAYRHVEFTRDYNTSETLSTIKHPILVAAAHVKRKLGFYFWNIFIIVVLILGLSFAVLAIEPIMEERLYTMLTLFLTCIAFKIVVRATLPNISYLTYLDIYVVFALIFLAIQAVENAIMLHLRKFKSVASINKYDEIAQGCLIGLLVIFHLAFIIYIQLTAFSRQRSMGDKEVDYELVKMTLNKAAQDQNDELLLVDNPLYKQTQTSDSLLASLKDRQRQK